MIQNIQDKFKSLYPEFDFPAPESKQGKVAAGEQSLSYLWGQDENQNSYLDIYRETRMGMTHLRIKSDGSTAGLETYQEEVAYDPKIAGDKERALRQRELHNQKVLQILSEKGF